MGAGYGAGAYFFYRVYRTQRWHEVSVGVLSAAVFALLMLITTIVHFDKFNQGKAHDGLPDPPVLATIAYYGWTIVYILSPWVVAWLWWRNQRPTRASPSEGEPLVPANVRLVARVIAIGALARRGGRCCISPSTAIDNWGWTLTRAHRARARLLHRAGRHGLLAAVARRALEQLADARADVPHRGRAAARRRDPRVGHVPHRPRR